MTRPAAPLMFDTTTCGRCLGSGRYSWNAMHGDRCYGCGGTGYVVVKSQRAMRDEWHAAIRAQKRPTVADVQPGDDLAVDGKWRTVASVDVDTSDVRGRSGRDTGDGRGMVMTDSAWAATITYTDGSTQQVSTNLIVRRRSTTDAVLARVSDRTAAHVRARLAQAAA